MQEAQLEIYSKNKGEAMVFTTSALTVTMLVSYLLPALVALSTKMTASTWLKQFVSGILSAVTGLVVTATQLDGTAVFSKEALLLTLGSFILSQATYVSVYKSHDANSKIAPSVGLGR
jgi:glucan phosphoethanolaminetransferase (alkaline phosphatase superfamily)